MVARRTGASLRRYDVGVRILLTNDDGIDAPGLAAMRGALNGLGEVTTFAPAAHQSATSHAVTFHSPLTVEERRFGDGQAFTGLAIGGRPADCVKLGLSTLVDRTPDLVVSGLNAGANVGINVIYSGTVGAAREATILGVPAIAVSLHVGDWHAIRWADAAAHARRAVDLALDHGLPDAALININVPILDGGFEPRGLRVVRACTEPLVDQYEPSGDNAYRICSTMTFRRRDPGTDVAALFDGYITLTPLQHRLTDAAAMTALAGLDADAPSGSGVGV